MGYTANYASVENEVLRDRLKHAKEKATEIRRILSENRGYITRKEREVIEDLLKDI